MRFTINKEYFLKALNTTSRAALSKNTYPIYKNLKISLTDKGLSIFGSNGELSINVNIPFMINENEIIRNFAKGEILVDAKIITEIIRKISGTEITFEVIDQTIIQIDDGKSSFQLNSVRADEYPDIDMICTGVVFDVSTADFTTLVDQTAFAASTKEQRIILTALNLSIENGELTAVATDSARMAKKVINVNMMDKISANVNAKTISDIVRLFEDEKEVTIGLDEKKALFTFGNITIATTLINGEYPQTRNFIPKQFNYYLTADAKELIDAMERVALLSGERENVVKLSLNEDNVEVLTKSTQVGSARESIQTYDYKGERLEISFNSLYVIAAIKALNCNEVTICFIGEMKPFVVRNDADSTIVQLITPVKTY